MNIYRKYCFKMV